VEVFFVGRDPVGGYIFLCLAKVEFSIANHAVQAIFELIFNIRVPRVGMWFRPEIADVVRASQAWGNQVVHLKVCGGQAFDSIFLKDPLLHRSGDAANDLVAIC
jgi:hypothetical protein